MERVPTDKQLADIMTKPLTRQNLEYLRSNIMGWTATIHQYEQHPDVHTFISKVMGWTKE